MALIAIAVSFVTVAPMVAGLSKRPNGAEMAVFAPWARWRIVDAKNAKLIEFIRD